MRRVGEGRPRLVVLLAVAILLALGFGFGATQAQDTTEEVVSHPAHIHAGTCAELDPNPAAPLTDVGPRGFDVESGEFSDDVPDPQGALNVAPVEISESEAEINLDDVLAESHAINVHESAQNIDNYIACGDIGGVVFDDQLIIALYEQNDSGYSGIAILEPDGDNTNVTIYLAREQMAEEETPEASPEA
jgi:hypothetical protein